MSSGSFYDFKRSKKCFLRLKKIEKEKKKIETEVRNRKETEMRKKKKKQKEWKKDCMIQVIRDVEERQGYIDRDKYRHGFVV